MYHLHGQIFFLWKKLKEKVSFWKLKFRECSVELLLSRDKWFLIFQSFDFHACISARHLYTLKLKEITYYSKAGNIYQQSFKSTELFFGNTVWHTYCRVNSDRRIWSKDGFEKNYFYYLSDSTEVGIIRQRFCPHIFLFNLRIITNFRCGRGHAVFATKEVGRINSHVILSVFFKKLRMVANGLILIKLYRREEQSINLHACLSLAAATQI